MSAAVTATPVNDSRVPSRSWFGLGLALTIGAGVAAVPTPTGLGRAAQLVLSITAFTVVLWIFQVMNNGIAAVLMMALLIAAGIRPGLALSGFSTPSYWTLLAVLYYGFAMQKTGLAQRIAFYILSLFPQTYTGILAAFLVIGCVLTLGIPSMTVRTAIMVPIAWALVKALNFEQRGTASALIVLTTIEMAIIPGCALRYGSLFGPVVDSVFQAKHLPLTWIEYAEVMAAPILLLCFLVVFVNQKVLKPKAAVDSFDEFAKQRLRLLGKLRASEVITAIIVLVSIAYWATDRLHHQPSFLIGMFALAVFALTGILRSEDIGTGVSWSLLLFLGGIFGLANVIQEYKMTDWPAGFFVPLARHLTFSSVIFLSAIAVAMFILRFIDPTGFIAIPVLFLPMVGIATSAGISPLIFTAPLLIASVPFWLPYQNIWIAMGDGLTSGNAFTAAQRVRLANVYAIASIFTLAVSVGYWKLIGVL